MTLFRSENLSRQPQLLLGGKGFVEILYIRIDDNPAGWDAPWLKQLSVDHLPYAILVDAEGRVQTRDIRDWELDGIL